MLEKTTSKRLYFNQIGAGSLIWDQDAIEYAIMENDLCHGKSFEFIFDNQIFSGMAIIDGGTARISNSNLNETVLSSCFESVSEYLGVKKIILQTPIKQIKTFDFFKPNALAGLCDCPKTGTESTLYFDLA